MIAFHPLTKSDIEIIVPMVQDFYALYNYPIHIETSKKLFTTFIKDKKLGQCWLISDDKTIVGYVILTYVFSFEHQGQIAFLDELFITKSARGKGIAKNTLGFIRNYAFQKNLRIIYLEIEPHNEAAKNLYLKNDFILHNRALMKSITKS
jgi:RimJ/RimL family protein N-acetyltransferase